MTTSEFLRSAAIIVVILLVFGLAAFGLNFYTQPIIEANNAGAANDRLNAVMSTGAKGFEDITSTLTLPSQFVDPSNSKRTASIVAVHKETSGLGYVVEVNWTSEDSHGDEPNLALVGISADGKIIAVNNEAYHDTDAYNIFNKDPNYASSFAGQDSTLADVGLVAGSTHSSSAFRSAVSHAFEVLVLNDMITAGVKSDDQILTEALPLLHTGLSNSGTIVGTEVAASGNIVKGWTSKNGTGAAYIMSKGEDMYLVLVNNSGVATVYDTDMNDVTAVNGDLVAEAETAFGQVSDTLSRGVTNKIKNLFGEDALDSVEKLTIDTFNTVSLAAKFSYNNETVYMFQSKPYTYGNNMMTIYTFISESGEIVKQDLSTLIYDHYDIPGFDKDSSSDDFKNWINQYVGVTEDTLSDDLLITGATLSSTAVKNATADAFAAFNSIKGGEQ